LFKLIGKISGKKILDTGCGEGFIARELSRKGARVIGVDLSKKLIKLAQNEETKNPIGVSYYCASLDDLSRFSQEEFDMIIANLVLHDLEPLKETISEFNRILKRKGNLIISLLNPILKREDYFRKDWYGFDWGGKYKTLASYHRPISDYFMVLIKEGFLIEKVIEPRPIVSGLKYKELQEWDKKPLFIFIKVKKC
jgi:2-polyprenyl-3-methyl-5-hydroxy-6-metoxy-1,4-benzoquinol methylase